MRKCVVVRTVYSFSVNSLGGFVFYWIGSDGSKGCSVYDCDGLCECISDLRARGYKVPLRWVGELMWFDEEV